MATAAAEEAPGKGIMEVQKVTESSGPAQPKSLDGLPSAYNSHDFRKRPVSKGKSKLGQVVSEVSLHSSKAGDLASKKAAEKPENAGVERVELGGPDRNLLKVKRDGVDAVNRANSPRQKTGYARLGSQQEPMKDGMEAVAVQNKEDDKVPMLQAPVLQSIQDSESAVDSVETTNTENSNPSQENAESSCKSKTAEWTLLVTSVVLEATSASCDQLGYALTSMVMAFLALFLSILDLILKARGREITCDGRGLLPCFYRHSSHDIQNREPFAGVVQYFCLAGSLWQCSFTTVGYNYTHHKLVNPIKLCLLPFILALCVLISKVVKSSQRARLDSNAD